jgi:fumarylacetoacetate (FAA) hydrolase
MRLLTFERPKLAGETFGVLVGEDRVLDLSLAFAWYEERAGRAADAASVEGAYGADLLGFIRAYERARPIAAELLTSELPSSFRGRDLVVRLSDVRVLAPLPRPPSMRDGYAFRQHVEAARRNRGVPMIPEYDEFPVFYFTNHQAVTGPGNVEVEKLHLNQLDFELEVAAVIGREGKNIAASEADGYIFGLMVMNDWSARALQMQEMKLNLGPAKGKDFATSIGPWLVTLDELSPVTSRGPKGASFDLTMTARVNDVEVSRGNVKDMTYTFAELVERASYGVTLYPGDVIGSGTVGTGCFLELNGSGITNQWLAPGDEVVLEIDRLGRLENRIVLRSRL